MNGLWECQQSQSRAVLGARQLQVKGTEGLSPGAHEFQR